MELKDLFLTPFYLVIIFGIAYLIRPYVTSSENRKYFIPALTFKIIGAISVGVIYYFYYTGGDTNHYYNSAKVISAAFYDSPLKGLKLIFSENSIANNINLTEYIGKIYNYESDAEFFVIRTAGLFSIISFGCYSVIAIFFAVLSFSGIHALYLTFVKIYPKMMKETAYAVYFVPSLVFWGSGILKDSICIGALGWLFWAFYKGLIEKKGILFPFIIFILSFLTLFIVKKYILLAIMPPIFFWLFLEYGKKIKSRFSKIILKPFLLIIGLSISYYVFTNITKGDANYDVEKIAERTKINADYLYQVSLAEKGSGYYLGELDGTISGMIKLSPQAILTALYRPLIYEAKNIVMLLSSLECLILTILTLKIIFTQGFNTIKRINSSPFLLLCLTFSLIFAFVTGINSSNFGTLVRYKIPMLPFFITLLLVLNQRRKIAT